MKKNKSNLKKKDWVHFIGIGGAGMNTLASLALKRGYKVSGSDIRDSDIIKKLKKRGAHINIGHNESNVEEGLEKVIFSSCIPKDNIEMLKAKKMSIPIYHRSEFLAHLMEKKYNIVVCGSHGKTTTSALIYHILYNAGFNISASIGGSSYNSYENIDSDTEYFVAEADESDGSFVNLSSNCVVITNIDKDHFDFYKNFENMISYFNKFLSFLPKDGVLFLNNRLDKYKKELLKNIRVPMYTFGTEKDSDINVYNIKLLSHGVNFRLDYSPYFEDEKFKVKLPGIYNLENALSAIMVCAKLGVSVKDIRENLLTFKGVRRRFQVRLENKKFRVIEDYAHHPTEIEAVLKTVKQCYNFNRVIGVFQPHRYTRTQLLSKELAESLHPLDILILTDIYSASESPIPGVSSKNIYRYSCNNGHKNVKHLSIEEIFPQVIKEIELGDLILILGAGDIYKVARQLEKELKC